MEGLGSGGEGPLQLAESSAQVCMRGLSKAGLCDVVSKFA